MPSFFPPVVTLGYTMRLSNNITIIGRQKKAGVEGTCLAVNIEKIVTRRNY